MSIVRRCLLRSPSARSHIVIYDPIRRVYTQRGRTLTPKEVRDHVETLIQSEQSQVDQESKKVLLGILPLVAFFDWMREKIRTWHSIAGVIAYGGQGQMNLERWKRINEKIQSELGFLDKWQVAAEQGLRSTWSLAVQAGRLAEKDESVPSGLHAVVEREVQSALMASDAAGRSVAVRNAIESALVDSIEPSLAESVAAQVTKDLLETQRMEDLIWGSLSSRGKMYADSSYATFANSEKARELDEGTARGRRVCIDDDRSCDECVEYASEDYQTLADIPDIGDATCLGNCRCVIEFELFNVEPLEIERGIYA